jgi:type II secretory pathway component PulJ
MLAIGIFALVLTAIYSTWISVLRGTRAALTAAAEVQRQRIAVRALEEALSTAVYHAANPQHYWFIADTKGGDYATLSFVANLPETFPGSGLYRAEDRLRHVSFSVEDGIDGNKQLVLRQWPLLQPTNNAGSEPYTIILGRDVDKFALEFWDQGKKEWADEWTSTNLLPQMVSVSLAMGNRKGVTIDEKETITRVIGIHAMGVPREWQMPVPAGQRGGGGVGPGPRTQPNTTGKGIIPP